jgi:protein SCO1/2
MLGKPLPVIGQVAAFTLTNQNGTAVSLSDFRGKVWVADIIFTRCPGPCLKMTRQMKELQEALTPTNPARFVTLTTDPTYDSPAVLKTFAGRFDADFSRWIFLTGPKTEIAKLASGSLKLTALENPPDKRPSPAELFAHSTIFVIVDKHGQLRGAFATGEGVDPAQVKNQILAGIRRLEREP